MKLSETCPGHAGCLGVAATVRNKVAPRDEPRRERRGAALRLQLCQVKKNSTFFFSQKCSNIFEQKISVFNFFFKSVQIYMKDAECAELKEKSNFRFFRLLFFELKSFLY